MYKKSLISLIILSIGMSVIWVIQSNDKSSTEEKAPGAPSQVIDEFGLNPSSRSGEDPLLDQGNDLTPSGSPDSSLPTPQLTRAEFEESAGEVYVRAQINNFSVDSCKVNAEMGELTKTFQGIIEEQPKFMLCRRDVSYDKLGASGKWSFSVIFIRSSDNNQIGTEERTVDIQ